MKAKESSSASSSKKPSNSKSLILLAAVVVLAGVAAGLWLYFSGPASANQNKRLIAKYLENQTGRSDFSMEFKFPSKEEMSQDVQDPATIRPLDVGPLTKKTFNALKDEYITLHTDILGLQRQLAGQSDESDKATEIKKSLVEKENTREPVLSDLWAFQRAWAAQRQVVEGVESGELGRHWAEVSQSLRAKFADAANYAQMYSLIGHELWVAERLLASANRQHRRLALAVARQAASDAIRNAENGWLGARIIEAYIWPHLEAADPNPRSALSLENLLSECADIFRRLDDNPSVVRNYMVVLLNPDTPQRADWARAQVSRAYERIGDYPQAIQYLRQIEHTNSYSSEMRRIPYMEQRIKSK